VTEFFSLLIAGITFGAIYAVSASGLVVTYNTTGIFNFAHGAMGMVMAYLFWQLWQGWALPELLSLAIVLFVAAPILGIVVERVVMRQLYGAATSIRLAVTLGLLLVLVAAAGAIWSPTANTYNTPDLVNGNPVSVAGITLSWEQLITVAVAIAVAIFLRVFFRRTRTGVAMRAVVDDPGLASLAGAPSGRISAYAWMIGVMFAGLGGILLAPSVQGMNIETLTQLVIYGYAAAVVGRLRSLPMTFLGAMILGVANSMAIGYSPQSVVNDVDAALPMALLFLVLLFIPEVRLAIGRVVRVRPPRVASARTTLAGAAFVVLVVIVLGAVLTGNNLFTMGNGLALSILALSLVPLSGYAGQVSLCQFTFLGIGAVTMHAVDGGGSVLGLLAAVGVCAGVGAVLALPVLRLRGLYLALATLAFAVLMDSVFFQSSSIMGVGGTVTVGRPDIFGMRFTTDRAFDVFLAIILGLCLIGVGALRRGRFGRRLVSMNDSPAACSTVGMSLTITKLLVFAFSAGMAGLAGALYGGISTVVGAAQFDFLFSIAIFVGLTLTGVNLLTGAVMAGAFIAVGPVIGAHIPQIPDLTQLLIGFGVVTIGRNPNGIGRFYEEVTDFWNRRHGRGGPIADELDAVPGDSTPVPVPVPAAAMSGVGTEVRSVV
jgi:branched-chain amino acid transport system permease protein